MHDDENDEISKSERKRRMHALQDLGMRLVALREEALAGLDLPDVVADAVRHARTLAREARRRQLQYIGKLLRRHELPDLVARVDALEAPARAATQRLHQVEGWRDRLLDDDAALDALLGDYPDVDVQRLRTLIRNARHERAAGAPPRSRRAIFQLLTEILAGSKR